LHENKIAIYTLFRTGSKKSKPFPLSRIILYIIIMNKFPLFLVLALGLSSAAFADDSKDVEKRKAEYIERSKNCRAVCKNGEVVFYKGNKKASSGVAGGGSGSIADMGLAFFGSDCPSPPRSEIQKASELSKTCRFENKRNINRK